MGARPIGDRQDQAHNVHVVGGLVALCLAAWTGCSIEYIKGPPEHIVMINSEGRAIDPTGNFICQGSTLCRGWHAPVWFYDYDELGTNGRESYDDYLTRIFTNLRKHADVKNGGKRKVLIFVHGGLNSQRKTIGRAERLSAIIAREPNPDYPIFINWDSSFFSGYYDYLFHIRQGTYYPSYHPYAWVLAPFYFLADTGRGILQAPSIWFSELAKSEPEEWLQGNVYSGVTLPIGSEIEHNYRRVAQELKESYAQNPSGDVMAISEGKDQREFWFEGFQADLIGALTLPFKMISAPFIETFGESSWRMNQRRTRVLYQSNQEFVDEAGGKYSPPAGGLAQFMERLAREYYLENAPDISEDKKKPWDITLVGHSMGAIILNEAIRRFGVTTLQDKSGMRVEVMLPFNRIVYLGAASSIRDYEDSVFPYLKRNQQARFYHLVLHEEAEERETAGFDLALRGSILVWLDDFMNDPETPLDRTLGNYVNLMLAAHDTPDAVRRRISIKAFGAGKTAKAPQTHSELTEKFVFWKEECWKPGEREQPECFDEDGH
jgi:hypothetical protein